MPDGSNLSPVTSCSEKRISLKTLLRQYNKTYRDYGKALKAVDVLEEDKDKLPPELIAAEAAATNRYEEARTAMIQAPVATFADIAAKLRFYFEVGGDPQKFARASEWEDQIVKNILRDISPSPTQGPSLQAMREECIAAFRASQKATEVADREQFRVRKLHPPCPERCLVEHEWSPGKMVRRPADADDLLRLRDEGDLTPEDTEKRIAELLEWKAACDAIDAQHPKIRELRDADHEADAFSAELDDKFVDAPAHTLADIRTKLEFLFMVEDMKSTPDHYPARLVFGLMRDIDRMTGANPSR